MSHGSEKRVRTAHLTIRLAPEERAAIDDAAARAGLTSGSYARQVVLGAPPPRQVRRPPVEKKELASLLGQLGRVGSNLNQIARAANSEEQIDVIDLAADLKGLALVRDAILKALGREP
jgi:uncharacterized protein (DUF1778 family)